MPKAVVHLVALAGVATDADVTSEVASVLGVRTTRPPSASHRAISPEVLAGIIGALGPGPALLVLDNCEHVIGGVAELAGALVSMTQDLRVLTTSRAPLGLLSGGGVPAAGAIAGDLYGAVREARAGGAHLKLTCPRRSWRRWRHLDVLPLAVELAAARVRVLSVAEIARRLEDRFGLAAGGARDAPERHQTLQAVVDWSWNLLDPAGQAAMRALSVFPGGFTAEAAGHLLGDDEVLGVLEHLVDQSLLQVADTWSGTRFRMLETVREFSTAQREAAGETSRVLAGPSHARNFGVAHHESASVPILRRWS